MAVQSQRIRGERRESGPLRLDRAGPFSTGTDYGLSAQALVICLLLGDGGWVTTGSRVRDILVIVRDLYLPAIMLFH